MMLQRHRLLSKSCIQSPKRRKKAVFPRGKKRAREIKKQLSLSLSSFFCHKLDKEPRKIGYQEREKEREREWNCSASCVHCTLARLKRSFDSWLIFSGTDRTNKRRCSGLKTSTYDFTYTQTLIGVLYILTLHVQTDRAWSLKERLFKLTFKKSQVDA